MASVENCQSTELSENNKNESSVELTKNLEMELGDCGDVGGKEPIKSGEHPLTQEKELGHSAEFLDNLEQGLSESSVKLPKSVNKELCQSRKLSENVEELTDNGENENDCQILSEDIQLNEYAGYEPEVGIGSLIDRLPGDVSPQVFFDNYVSQRKPVIIENASDWNLDLWKNEYLAEKAGETKILVEKRIGLSEGMFGLSAPKVEMAYKEFLEKVNEGSEQYYLTTQDLERFDCDLDEFGMPQSVLAEPLKSLKEDFPVRPALMGKLIPHQVSLWQGYTKAGTSSGLHHDFHDNLYVLYRGRKRFRLIPPSAVQSMKTMGKPVKVHKNGLIVYECRPRSSIVSVRADGVPMSFIAREKRNEALQELSSIEEEIAHVHESRFITPEEKKNRIVRLQKIMSDWEDQIDVAMEEMLQYGDISEFGDYAQSDVISIHGDDSEPESVDSKRDENGDEEKDLEPPSKQPRLELETNLVPPSKISKDMEKVPKLPDHFCNVVLPSDTNDPEKLFANLVEPERISCMIVELKKGEMLYLPASWFHEVTSYSVETADKDSSGSDHLALNYWFYPPDGEKFEQPYCDKFWQKRWDKINNFKSAKERQQNASKEVITLDSDDSSSVYSSDSYPMEVDSFSGGIIELDSTAASESQRTRDADLNQTIDLEASNDDFESFNAVDSAGKVAALNSIGTSAAQFKLGDDKSGSMSDVAPEEDGGNTVAGNESDARTPDTGASTSDTVKDGEPDRDFNGSVDRLGSDVNRSEHPGDVTSILPEVVPSRDALNDKKVVDTPHESNGDTATKSV